MVLELIPTPMLWILLSKAYGGHGHSASWKRLSVQRSNIVERNGAVQRPMTRTMDIKHFEASHLFPVSTTPNLWVGGITPVDGSPCWYWDQVFLVIVIMDAVVWSESKHNDSGGELVFYHSEVSDGCRVKWEQSEMFLHSVTRMPPSRMGGSNNMECIIKLQGCRSWPIRYWI